MRARQPASHAGNRKPPKGFLATHTTDPWTWVIFIDRGSCSLRCLHEERLERVKAKQHNDSCCGGPPSTWRAGMPSTCSTR